MSTPLIFITLGEDLVLRLDTILAAEEELYTDRRKAITWLTILGRKDRLAYHGPLSDLTNKIDRVMSSSLAEDVQLRWKP